MNEYNLKYLKDTEGRYIIKQTVNEEIEEQHLISTGVYSENLIISKEYFNKKLQHKLDDIIKVIEESVMKENKIFRQDILSERIVADITPEEEFNPLFKNLSKKEIQEYTKNSSKVRVNITFEIAFKIKPHLWFKVFTNLFKKSED